MVYIVCYIFIVYLYLTVEKTAKYLYTTNYKYYEYNKLLKLEFK